MKNHEIHIRDPFVLVHDGKYYLYGTRGKDAWTTVSGFDVYVGDDLENWSGPISVFEANDDFWGKRQFWAPEVHAYRGKFYMFASFYADGHWRASHILVSERPEGPFVPLTKEAVTPKDWACLDATLFVDEAEKPYLVFCHEWTQIGDGTINYVPMTEDLTAWDGEVPTLFSASSHPLNGFIENPEWGRGCVTDGPFLWRTQNDRLLMMWSSNSKDGNYQQILSESESGKIAGPWRHLSVPIFERDGGHGMVFRDRNGDLRMCLHRPNVHPLERPMFFRVAETENGLTIV